MEKKMINKTFTNEQVFNITSWYKKMRGDEATKHKFDCLPFKMQFALRSNIKTLEDAIQPFEEMIKDYKTQLQSEFFTEDKTVKVTDENGAEMLKLKDEYLKEYVMRGNELQEKLNEVSNDQISLNLACYDMESILDNLDDDAIEKSGMDVDDFAMLEFMKIEEEV